MFALIVGVVIGALVLTGCGFYFIPKYAMNTSNAWINIVDSAIGWIGNNWILFTIIMLLVIITIVLLVIIFRKRKR